MIIKVEKLNAGDIIAVDGYGLFLDEEAMDAVSVMP